MSLSPNCCAWFFIPFLTRYPGLSFVVKAELGELSMTNVSTLG